MTNPAGSTGSRATADRWLGWWRSADSGDARQRERVVRALVYLLGIVWIYRPSPHVLATTVPDNPGDPSFILWTLSWLKHAALHHPSQLLNGNIFWPHHETLLYSDLLVGLAPLFVVATILTTNEILALNVVQLVLVAFALEATYRLGRALGLRFGFSVAAALSFGLGSFALTHFAHINLCAFGLLPFGLVLLKRFVDAPSLPRAAAYGAACGVTFLTAGYYAVILAVATAVVVMSVAVSVVRSGNARRFVGGLGVVAIVAGLIAGPATIEFLSVSHREGFERRPEELVAGRLHVGDLVRGPEGSALFDALGRDAEGAPEHGNAAPLTMVLGFVVAAIASGLRRERRRTEPRDRFGWSQIALAGAVSLLLAFGDWGAIGMPFRLLRAGVPGFSSVRVPARFVVLALLALSLLGARAWQQAASRLARSHLVAALVIVAVLAENTVTLDRWAFDERPPVVAVNEQLSRLPAGPVLELPMLEVRTVSGTLIETSRMVYSTRDRLPRVNGYSSYIPSDNDATRHLVGGFPDETSLARIKELGVRYVVVEFGRRNTLPLYTEDEARARIERLPTGWRASRVGLAWLVEVPTDGSAVPREH